MTDLDHGYMERARQLLDERVRRLFEKSPARLLSIVVELPAVKARFEYLQGNGEIQYSSFAQYLHGAHPHDDLNCIPKLNGQIATFLTSGTPEERGTASLACSFFQESLAGTQVENDLPELFPACAGRVKGG